jgi:hypothetical protein
MKENKRGDFSHRSNEGAAGLEGVEDARGVDGVGVCQNERRHLPLAQYFY